MVEVMLVLTYQQEMLCHAHVIHVSVSKASITRKAHVKFSVSSSYYCSLRPSSTVK